MAYYEDNPEGLEPEDYIDDYGEAGRSAWNEPSYRRSEPERDVRHSNREYLSGGNNVGGGSAGCLSCIVLASLFVVLLVTLF